MPNLIAALVVFLALFTGIKTDFPVNPLLGMGILITIGYLFSLIAKHAGIPRPFGYIFAGLIAGPNGLGFLSGHFTDGMVLIESIAIMLLTIKAAEAAFNHTTIPLMSRHAAIAITSLILVAVLVMGFLSPVGLSLEILIIFSLFSIMLSPLISGISADDSPASGSTILMAFFSFTLSVVIWGAALPFLAGQTHQAAKFMSMPLIIGATSVFAGFAWGFAGEKVFLYTRSTASGFLPLIEVFLLFPLIRIAGFDMPFAAAGIGMYYGLISEKRTSIGTTGAITSEMIVYGLLGIKLPLFTSLLMPLPLWKIASLLSFAVIFSRYAVFKIIPRILGDPATQDLKAVNLIPYGPLSFIILMRFMNALPAGVYGVFGKDATINVLTTAMLVTLVFSALLHGIIHVLPGTASTIDVPKTGNAMPHN